MELKQAQIEISKEIDKYKEKLGIDRSLKIKFTESSSFQGGYKENCITVSEGAVKRWEDIPDNVRFLIVHELVHAKYYDELSCIENVIGIVWSPIALKLAFRELRANTIAHQTLGADHYLLNHYFNNTFWFKGPSYYHLSGGYLPSKDYIELITRNPQWDQRAIDAAKVHFKKKKNFSLLPISVINNIAKPFECELTR